MNCLLQIEIICGRVYSFGMLCHQIMDRNLILIGMFIYTTKHLDNSNYNYVDVLNDITV